MDFNVTLCKSRHNVSTIPRSARALCMNCVLGRTAVYVDTVNCAYSLRNQDYKNHRAVLLSEFNGIPLTGVILAYAINPFGLSAGHVFIRRTCLQQQKSSTKVDVPLRFNFPAWENSVF